MPPVVQKAVCYVVAEGHLLVFTHDRVPLTVTGVQVPAGTIRPDESPVEAAARELHEETGLVGSVVRVLGTAVYDLAPARDEIAHRHFFLMDVGPVDTAARWHAGEAAPEDGGPARPWSCWWLPLSDAHVLVAGLGAKLGALSRGASDRRPVDAR